MKTGKADSIRINTGDTHRQVRGSGRWCWGMAIAMAALLAQGCATQRGPVSGGAQTRIPRPGPVVAQPLAHPPVPEAPTVQTVPLQRAIPPRPQPMPIPTVAEAHGEQTENPGNPVVIGLLQQADQLAQSGRLDRAAASIERGLRIAPKDASLWQRLANIKLAQGDSRQAESMAKKSIAFARGHRGMIADNWKIIAQARELRGDQQGAMRAREKSLQFSSPGF